MIQMVKNPPAMQVSRIQSLGWEDPLEKGMVTHSSILAWRSPWIEETWGHKEWDMTEWLTLSLSNVYISWSFINIYTSIYLHIYTHTKYLLDIFLYIHIEYIHFCVCVLPTSDFFNSVLPSVYYFLLPGIYINENIFMAKIFGL